MYERDPRSRVFAPLAEAYRGLGMVEKAFEILREGIKHHPDYVMGYLGLASCYADEEEWTNVYSTLRPFVSKNRDNLRLQKVFAKACLNINHHDEALETYKYILFLNPNDSESSEMVSELEESFSSNYVLGDEKDDDGEEGKKRFDLESLSSDPIYDDEVEGWETIDLSSRRDEKDEKQKESDWTQERFEIEKEESVAKSYMHFENESTDQIEEDLKTTPVITHTLVDLYCSQGHIEKAIEVLEKILELNPDDTKTLAKLEEVKLLLIDDDLTDYYTEDVESNDEELLEGETEDEETLDDEDELDIISQVQAVKDEVSSEADEHQKLLEEIDRRVKREEPNEKHEVIFKLQKFLDLVHEKSQVRG